MLKDGTMQHRPLLCCWSHSWLWCITVVAFYFLFWPLRCTNFVSVRLILYVTHRINRIFEILLKLFFLVENTHWVILHQYLRLIHNIFLVTGGRQLWGFNFSCKVLRKPCNVSNDFLAQVTSPGYDMNWNMKMLCQNAQTSLMLLLVYVTNIPF